QRKSILKEVATDLANELLPPAYEREHELRRLTELLTRPMPRSVLLVGRSGVGKTALVRELARQQQSVPEAFALWSTSGARLVAGMSGFGMWQDRCDRLVREASRLRVILHLDHLVELIEVGKGGGSSQGVASVLRPAISAGKLLSIAECSPEELAIIEREDPQLLEAFVRLDVDATTPEQTRLILVRAAELKPCVKAGTAITPNALAALDRLHRRFATYSAAPGRPLRFLRNLLQDRATNQSITEQDVSTAFSQETGLPLFMLDDAIPLDIAATRDWFARRVIGQTEPVERVVDLLAATKAGLSRGGKPIASLLFIGPTGVGKTEMAKSLAEFLYQDRGRMIRFDMSEYAHPAALDRLIGGQGASQGLLTRKVRDQPFMVVLLDEFEKAHASFHDVLLQVLGEGRLTDGAGRIADFTSTVVIMTSNLGADTFRQSALGFGSGSSGENARQHFEREVKAFLRPEMFNRLDRILPFDPLDETVIAKIAAREIDRAIERDGLRMRGVNVILEADVVSRIAQQGYDARYGARPLKRAIERELIAPLAERITGYGAGVAIDCRVGLRQGRLEVESTARPIAGTVQQIGGSGLSVTQAIEQLIELRRKVQGLEQSGALLRIRNELVRMKQVERQRRARAKRRNQAERYVFSPEQHRAEQQRQLLSRVDKLSQEVATLEERTLLDLYASRPIDATFVAAARDELHTQLQSLLFDLYRDSGERAQLLTVVIYSSSMKFACQMAAAYVRLCAAEDCPLVRRHWLKIYREDLDVYKLGNDDASAKALARAATPGVELPVLHLKSRRTSESDVQRKVVDVYTMAEDGLNAPKNDCIGLTLQVTGPRAIALLQTESGKHLFLRDGVRQATCHVETTLDPLVKYDPPADAGRMGAFREQRDRRTYDLSGELCHDALLKQTIGMPGAELDKALSTATHGYLAQRIWELIDTWN
ncbi:MAG TPA: AAA family ATPase, partial [Pirellulaceae bacterium]|nr:AAA family ATPase [Pirellulaceae bacterium]